MVVLVLTVNVGGWDVELVSEPMSEAVADLLLIELSRDPSLRILKAIKSRG